MLLPGTRALAGSEARVWRRLRVIPSGAASDSLGALVITGIDKEIWYCDNSRGN